MNALNQTKIINYAENFKNKPFETGINDCNIMLLEVHDLLYETDLADRIKGLYKTFISGAKVAKKNIGYTNILDFLLDSPNVEQIDIRFCSIGDVIIKKEKGYCSCALHLGTQLLVADEDNFTQIIPTSHLNNEHNDCYVFRFK